MYHLPLLPGYGPNANIRSSASSRKKIGKSPLGHLSEAEENGYQGPYFPAHSPPAHNDGYISASPIGARKSRSPSSSQDTERVIDGDGDPGFMTDPETILPASRTSNANPNATDGNRRGDGDVNIDPGAETDPGIYAQTWRTKKDKETPNEEPEVLKDNGKEKEKDREEDIAEVVFFEYGVVVFFGLQERQEKDILEDIDKAGIIKRILNEDDWEIEECHYEVCLHGNFFYIIDLTSGFFLRQHDPYIAYPRIYNDFFSMWVPQRHVSIALILKQP